MIFAGVFASGDTHILILKVPKSSNDEDFASFQDNAGADCESNHLINKKTKEPYEIV